MEPLLSLINQTGVNSASIKSVLVGLSLAFLLGQMGSWVYMRTHTGISYSRSFVQSISVLTVIVAQAMMVIGSNVVVAFGMLGALSMIRFRNVLKDTRDTAFIFYAVVSGIACGTQNWLLAMAGGVSFSLLILYLHGVGFGSQNTGDGFFRFFSEVSDWNSPDFQAILYRHCHATQLISQRIHESGRSEVTYRVHMRDLENAHSLLEDIKTIATIADTSLVIQEEEEI